MRVLQLMELATVAMMAALQSTTMSAHVGTVRHVIPVTVGGEVAAPHPAIVPMEIAAELMEIVTRTIATANAPWKRASVL